MAMPSNTQNSSQNKAGKTTPNQQNANNTALSRLNDITTRLRLCEERINQNKERLRVYDDQIIHDKKEIIKEISNISSDITDLRKSIKNIDDTIHHIIKELELTAKKQEINVIEKYVNMMDPTRYVTKEEFNEKMKK